MNFNNDENDWYAYKFYVMEELKDLKESLEKLRNKVDEIKALVVETKTKVSYTPIIEVIYGTPETMVYEEGTDGESGYLRVKSFSTDSQDDGFYVEVERRDITQHTLDNFVEV